MTAHSAHFRAGGLFLESSSGRLPPVRLDVPGGWQGLSPAPLPVGEHFVRPVTAVRGLGFHPASVKDARDFAHAVLAEWGFAGLSADVRLVVSELVTNACRHAAPVDAGLLSEWSIQFGLVRDDHELTCMVFDPSRVAPAMADPDDCEEGGRGLRLIDTYSSKWGWNILDGQGKVVWAAFSIPDAP
ncbi:ATP-binding protein [Streptomonospora nanhaiensis]|uniref:Anti-sigma regulatory factor (Ser/Thr protein kinase) n=1 Tax=Streptomonospora nanhaiensis TaxID=1323731 RepID=A0A853BUT0_9ACTN|nr:ATP-binding protein [Streptomonospora nanhaiensis]MBV2363698.1 ATP-binding protein [Streptomonospora nanhaiensis]MBX9387712.1 ATP-binding protein [Streptomonospora nanhaiensis]MBX9390880.1 ATP-binding protein [Streptomonospora nanhaiensis]NYI98744.1 anti-sigma regulatory factor (Ser/Thr protein kinase) [Streptomonospora nanhaiensis]